MSNNPGGINPDVLQDSAQLQDLIEKEIENNKRQRAYNLYKTSLGDRLTADEREILLWRARRVLLATSDEVPDAVSITGTNEDVQLAGSWDFERMDYFLVPLWAFGPRAFSTLTLAQLYERARDTWQQAEAGFGAFVLAPAPADTDAAQLAQLEKFLDDIKGFHYSLIAAGLHLYVIVERLRNQYGNLVLLQVQSQLAALILQYCAHDPQSAFPLEEAGLHSLEAIPSLVTQVQDFLTSPEAVLPAPGAPAPAAPQLVASPNPAPATVRAVFGRFARDFGDLSRVRYVPGTGKKAQVAAVFAVNAGEVTVDLSPGRPPADILTDLSAMVAGFLQDESYTIDSLRAAAASLKYNLQTNEWGSVAAGTEYVAQLEAIRKNILRYMKIDDTAGATIPRIFYKQYNRVLYLRGGLVPGEVYHSDTLMPNESVQKRMSAKQFTKQSLSENRSFTQAVDDTARSQIDSKMEDETTNRQEDTTNVNTYNNTQDHFEVGVKAGYNASIPKVGGKGSTGRGSQGGGQGINVAFNIGYSKDTQKGTSKDVNSTREAQQRVLNSVNNSMMNEHKATASQTVGSSAESTVEETTEQSTTRTFSNPNTASTLRLDLVGLLRKVYAVSLVYDVKIFFSNGVAGAEADIKDIDDLLDSVLLPEAQCEGLRQSVKDEIYAGCHVVDYAGRVVNLLNEDNNPPTINPGLYFDLLAASAQSLDLRDSPLLSCARHLGGVVFGLEEMEEPTDATHVIPTPSKAALDDNSQRLFEVERRTREADARIKEFGADKAGKEVEMYSALVDFLQNLPEGSPEEIQAKIDAFFKTTKDSASILGQLVLEGWFSPKMRGSGIEVGTQDAATLLRNLGIH